METMCLVSGWCFIDEEMPDKFQKKEISSGKHRFNKYQAAAVHRPAADRCSDRRFVLPSLFMVHTSQRITA